MMSSEKVQRKGGKGDKKRKGRITSGRKNSNGGVGIDSGGKEPREKVVKESSCIGSEVGFGKTSEM